MADLGHKSTGATLGVPLLAWVGFVALVLLAPVFRGGNRYLPLLLLEALAVAVLLALAWRWLRIGSTTRHASPFWARGLLLALVLSPLWVALLQLVPLPQGAPAQAWRPASLAPEATWAAVFAGLPVVASFCIALAASSGQLAVACRLWLAVALFQAAWGLLQLGPFPGLYAGLSSPELVGTFASKNTYSNFLVMAIPLVVLPLSGQGMRLDGRNKDEHRPRWLWGIALFVLMATLLAAGSRTGIATGLLACLLAVALLPGRQSRRWAGLPWAFWGMALLVVLALAAGGLAWLDRFDADLLVADDAVRGQMRQATWQGALAFWPLGSGLGSYATVFARFQPPELGRHLIDLAHNDYLQLLMELGALVVALAAALLALLIRRACQLARARPSGWQGQDTLAVAAGLGALAFGLHAAVDYPMRIPANAMFAAFLVGLFLRPTSDRRLL